VRVRFNHGYIVLFRYFNFNTDRILGLSVVVAREMDTDNSLHVLLVILILPQEVLDVFVLRERKLRER
jgi:hypothetical protein